MKHLFCLLLFLSLTLNVHAQEESEEKFLRSAVSLDISHAFISQGITDDGKKFAIEPSWEIGYAYYVNPHWYLSLSVHLILEDFEVETYENKEILEREKPVAPSLNVGYKATRHSSFALGIGGEFSNGESFFLTRFVYEWSTEITEKWELTIPFTYDMRWSAYDVWDIGIGVARRF